MIQLDQLSRRYGKTPSEYLRTHWLDHDFDSAIAAIAGWYENEVNHFDDGEEVKKKREKRERYAARTLHRLERAARKALGGEEANEEERYGGLSGLMAAGVIQVED